jgi:CheY-like chemotaxis protein
MKLNALVLSRNSGALKILVAALSELHIEFQICASPSEAIELLALGHCSALVIDFDLPQAVQVAKMARVTTGGRRPVLFGMIGAENPIGAAFQAGANFVLYKPLDLLQVLHSLRAAQAFMKPDRRHTHRKHSESLAYLELPAGTTPALVHDLTEQGLSLQAAEHLPPMRQISLRFLLPGTTTVVHAMGDFIWSDDQGRAGLFFRDLPAASRRDLSAWLRKHGAKKSEAVRALMEPKARRTTAAAQ